MSENNVYPFTRGGKGKPPATSPGGAPIVHHSPTDSYNELDHGIDVAEKLIVQCERAAKLLAHRVSENTGLPYIFRKPGLGLVDVSTSDGEQLPLIKKGHLKLLLDHAANFYRKSAKGAEVAVLPPNDVVDAIYDKPDSYLDIPELNRISTIPVMLPNGLLIHSGYTQTLKLLVKLPLQLKDLAVPEKPTLPEATAAVNRLLDHTSGMNTSPAGRSVWLSLLLSLAGRTAITGCVPGHGFDAAEAKAGKTTAVNLAYGLVFGEERETEGVPRDDAEVDKRTPMWSGQSLVFLDNLDNGQDFGSANFDRLLTSTKNKTRLLASNKSAAVDTSGTVFTLTGVNLSFKGDTASRFIMARLNTPLDRRYKFRPDNSYFAANQRQALIDAFTILRAYIQAGKPQPSGQEFNRFDGWNSLVRGAILWLGLADPVGNDIEDTAEETRRDALLALGALWKKLAPYEDAEREFNIVDLGLARSQLYGAQEDEKLRDNLRGALAALMGKRIDTHQDAGYALKKLRDVTVNWDGRQFLRITVREHKKQKFYRLMWGDMPQAAVQDMPSVQVDNTPTLTTATTAATDPSAENASNCAASPATRPPAATVLPRPSNTPTDEMERKWSDHSVDRDIVIDRDVMDEDADQEEVDTTPRRPGGAPILGRR